MKVAAYWNLNRDIFSIQSREKEDYGKVFAYRYSVVIQLPKFVVRQAGREKVLKEKKKNVHAFVVGTVSVQTNMLDESFFSDHGQLIIYNPYKYDSFVTADTKEPIYSGNLVKLRTHNNKPVMELW